MEHVSKLDNTAAISINLLNFDVKDISNRYFNYTNDFQIPVNGNQVLFEFIDNPHTLSDFAYTDFDVKILSGPFNILQNGRGYITGISGGYYNITVTDKGGFINAMKAYSLDNDASATYSVGTDNLTKQLINGVGGKYKIDFIYDDYQIGYNTTNPTKYDADYRHHYLSKYVKQIFSEFATASGYTFAGDLYTDTYFEMLRVLCARHTFRSNSVQQVAVSKDATFYDLFKEVLKIFCAVFKVTGTTVTVNRFDDLDWSYPADWQGKLMNINSKKYDIPGTGQMNYLRYEPQSGASASLNTVTMPCNNKNLQYNVDLIKINAQVFPAVYLNTRSFLYTNIEKETHYTTSPSLDVITDKGIDKFVFLSDGLSEIQTVTDVGIYYHGSSSPYTLAPQTHTFVAGDNKFIAQHYNSSGDYIRMKAMILNPVFYEVEMFLTPVDIQTFDPFNIVSIPQLNGRFYVNSIKNYLLSSPKKTATVELVKVYE